MAWQGGIAILCADGNRGTLPEAIDDLCPETITVLRANDGYEALRFLKSHRNEIKLAIIDTSLPVIDGVGLCKALRRIPAWHELPVALVGDSELERTASLNAGCTDYIPRPLSEAKLSEVIDKFIQIVRGQQPCPEHKQVLSVLVVDDTPEVRDVISRFLADDKVRVSEVDSGASMDELLKQHTPDIIILDVMMPGEDGLSILRRLKSSQETREIPVIMVSGLTDDEVISQSLEAGAADFLTKPFRCQKLLARIKSCRDTLKFDRMAL